MSNNKMSNNRGGEERSWGGEESGRGVNTNLSMLFSMSFSGVTKSGNRTVSFGGSTT
jgi:hypothetical protein